MASQHHDLLVGTSVHREPGESYEQAWQRRVTSWEAEPEMVRFFYPGLPSGSWPEFGQAISMVSFKLPLVDGRVDVSGLLDGRYDERLGSWFATMPADGTPKFVAFWHEPEDDVARGRFTSEQFRSSVEYVRRLASDYNGTGRNIEVGVVLMGYTANPSSGRSVADYLPSGVSFVGWDVYPTASELDTQTRFAQAAEATCNAGVGQWFLAETAIHAGEHASQRETAEWIPMATDVARELSYRGFMYFDSTVGGDFRLTSPTAKHAIGAEIRRR